MLEDSEVEDVESRHQGGRRQAGTHRHHLLITLTASQGRVETQDSDKLHEVLELDVPVLQVVQLHDSGPPAGTRYGQVQIDRASGTFLLWQSLGGDHRI